MNGWIDENRDIFELILFWVISRLWRWSGFISSMYNHEIVNTLTRIVSNASRLDDASPSLLLRWLVQWYVVLGIWNGYTEWWYCNGSCLLLYSFLVYFMMDSMLLVCLSVWWREEYVNAPPTVVLVCSQLMSVVATLASWASILSSVSHVEWQQLEMKGVCQFAR